MKGKRRSRSPSAEGKTVVTIQKGVLSGKIIDVTSGRLHVKTKDLTEVLVIGKHKDQEMQNLQEIGMGELALAAALEDQHQGSEGE